MHILVTGGCGYTGTILTNDLVNLGHKVTVVDIQWFGNYLKSKKIIKIQKINQPQLILLNLNQILDNFNNNGVYRVFYKKLAINDNSKNQPYFGSGWDVVSILPLGDISEYPGDRRPNFKCSFPVFAFKAQSLSLSTK